MFRVKTYNKFATVAFSFALGLSALVASPSVISSDAEAQNIKRGFKSSGNSRFKGSSFGRSFRSSSFGRSSARSGVRFANSANRSSGRTNSFQVFKRQRQILQRNDQVIRRNEQRLIQSQNRRTNQNGRFRSSLGDNQFINDGFNSGGSGVIALDQGIGSNCPSTFNCGYRLYPNGGGPRIITVD